MAEAEGWAEAAAAAGWAAVGWVVGWPAVVQACWQCSICWSA